MTMSRPTTRTSSTPQRRRKSRRSARRSCGSGGCDAARWPPAWRRPASGFSPSRACLRASGNRRARRMRSSGSMRSSTGASRRRPCSPRPRPRRCCSGRCSPQARSPCTRSTAGSPSTSRSPTARLTSPPEPIPSPRRRRRERIPTALATAPSGTAADAVGAGYCGSNPR